MKSVRVVFFVLLASCSQDADDLPEAVGQIAFLGELSWVRTFGGQGDDTAQAVVQAQDGGYAILGYTNSTDGDVVGKTLSVNDYWLLKLDTQGALQWQRTYGGSMDDKGQALAQTLDEGYILAGYAMSSDGDATVNQGFHDNWLVRVNATGDLMWEKSFGFSGHDHAYDVLQTEDGGYFFTGFLDVTSALADGYPDKLANPTAHGVGEFWGTKVDAEANLEWRGYFGGTNNDRAHAVVATEDGGYVMAGFTESTDFDIQESQGSYDFWLVRVDGRGNLVWQGNYGGSGIEIAQDIVTAPDGGFVVVGNSFSQDGDISDPKGASDIWMIKVDGQGTLEWERSFGGDGFDAAQAIAPSHDGGYFVVGNAKSAGGDLSQNRGENDIWVVKTNAQGGMEWQKSFGGTGLDMAFDVVQDRNTGGLLVVGETDSTDFPLAHTQGGKDMVVLFIR